MNEYLSSPIPCIRKIAELGVSIETSLRESTYGISSDLTNTTIPRIEYIRSQLAMEIECICTILDEVYGVCNDSPGLDVIPSILKEVSAYIHAAKDIVYLNNPNQISPLTWHEDQLHNEVTRVLRFLSH
jgi:hypothetical protein